MKYVIGIDIGGTKLSISVARLEGNELSIIKKIKLPTPKDKSYMTTLENLADMCESIIKQQNITKKDICGIGISCGGPLDSKKGIILSPPNLIGWDKVPITEFFETRLGLPASLQNDADACALAEWKFGAGRGCKNMIFLTFGTGLGAGLILDGKLYSGTNNMAGEIGHCRSPIVGEGTYSPVGYGKSGSFEGYCSGSGIAELGRAMVLERLQHGEDVSFCASPQDLDLLTAKTIADAAEAGDLLAKEIYRCSGHHLGLALSILIDLLNPEAIVIGSIYARSSDLLRGAAMEVIEKESLARSRSVCRILPAALGSYLGDVAALCIALNASEDPDGEMQLKSPIIRQRA